MGSRITDTESLRDLGRQIFIDGGERPHSLSGFKSGRAIAEVQSGWDEMLRESGEPGAPSSDIHLTRP